MHFHNVNANEGITLFLSFYAFVCTVG